MGHYEDTKMIDAAVNFFPEEFSLRAFPGETFCISRSESFVSRGEVMLYTLIKRSKEWHAFSKGTEHELRAQIVWEK